MSEMVLTINITPLGNELSATLLKQLNDDNQFQYFLQGLEADTEYAVRNILQTDRTQQKIAVDVSVDFSIEETKHLYSVRIGVQANVFEAEICTLLGYNRENIAQHATNFIERQTTAWLNEEISETRESVYRIIISEVSAVSSPRVSETVTISIDCNPGPRLTKAIKTACDVLAELFEEITGDWEKPFIDTEIEICEGAYNHHRLTISVNEEFAPRLNYLISPRVLGEYRRRLSLLGEMSSQDIPSITVLHKEIQ